MSQKLHLEMSKTFAFSSKNSLGIIIFFFFTIYFHHVHPYNDIIGSSDAEKSILLQLKEYWSNPSCLRHWNSFSNHCSWPEITCNTSGSVVGITVTYKCGKMIQTIPPLICDLEKLTVIDLSFNSIPGPFPISLSNCSNLKYLYLSGNSFSGSIPKNVDRLLSPHLEYLYLRNNRFRGGIPPTLGKYAALQHLDLSENDLTGTIPDDFGKLKRLSHLYLSSNRLSGQIPAQLAALPDLSHMDLMANQLSGPIPSTIGNGSSSLVYLRLSNNELFGEIPSEIGNLLGIKELDLSVNKFSGKIPSEIGNLLNLRSLDLSNNKFFGKLPSEIRNLSSLEDLNLSVNTFSGNLPSEIGDLSSLNNLDLSNNKFSGKFPPEIQNLSHLKNLDLSQNEFSSKIPPEIWKLLGLRYLDLSNNKFSGEIPSAISFPNLYFVNLSSNRLCGSIPEKLKYSVPVSSFSGISDSCNISDTSKSNQPIAAILSIVAMVLLLIMAFTFYIWRRCKSPRLRLGSTWKLISFQKLDFTASTILSNLTESNMIGRGGSGNVYKVQVNSAGQYVAVKRIFINEKMEDMLEKQFLSELQILGTIRHRNILKLMCCLSSENCKLLVYEYMENGRLDEWLHSERRTPLVSSSYSLQTNILEWPKRLHIAIAVAQGLCYMHHSSSSPIIHRDLKSSNILLDSKFNAKIADFGLARILDNVGVPRTMSFVGGTFGYMAPECAQTTRVNEKVDVYNFGVILLELVTGRKAHQGDENSSLAEWAWHHIQHGNPIVDALDEDIKHPDYLDEMIKVFKLGICCTHTLPSNRPTMKEVQEILHLCAHPSAMDKIFFSQLL